MGQLAILSSYVEYIQAGVWSVMPAGGRVFTFCNAFNSIGSPPQSHPGLHTIFSPRKLSLYRAVISLSILLSACPTCNSPFAYGGPS